MQIANRFVGSRYVSLTFTKDLGPINTAAVTTAPMKTYSEAVLCDFPNASNQHRIFSGTPSIHGNGMLCACKIIFLTSAGLNTDGVIGRSRFDGGGVDMSPFQSVAV